MRGLAGNLPDVPVTDHPDQRKHKNENQQKCTMEENAQGVKLHPGVGTAGSGGSIARSGALEVVRGAAGVDAHRQQEHRYREKGFILE